MNKTHSKKAFSLLTSMIVIILMATVAMFVMNLSGKIVKSTTAQYQRAQAELYAKSYTEFAILAVTGNDRSGQCLKNITGTIGTPSTGNGYDINTTIEYIGYGLPSSCTPLSNSVTTTKTPLTIIVDVFVKYKDPDNANGPWMQVHRRTVQKI